MEQLLSYMDHAVREAGAFRVQTGLSFSKIELNHLMHPSLSETDGQVGTFRGIQFFVNNIVPVGILRVHGQRGKAIDFPFIKINPDAIQEVQQSVQPKRSWLQNLGAKILKLN
jgi:hypothetical protein